MFTWKLSQKLGMIIAALAVPIVFSSPAMAVGAAGCGDDTDGDIGILPHPLVVQNNQSSSYDFTHCFTNGNTAGWNHTQSPAPLHGTLQINGSVVTYTPNPGYVGTDSYCLSCNGDGRIGGDGAQFDACSCNLTANFSVVAPPVAAVPTPALGTWAMLLMGLLLAAASLYRLRRDPQRIRARW